MQQIPRHEVISALGRGLREREFILAAWLEGADAHDRVDEYSDIDLWLSVLDGRIDEAIEAVASCLEAAGSLELAMEVDHPHPQIRQVFFRLLNSSEFLILDVCLQSSSREFVFTEGNADERISVLFDKAGVVLFSSLDDEVLRADTVARLDRLEGARTIYPTFVRKELARGGFAAALGAYQRYVLEPLVEAIRLRYCPTKAEFYLKHLEHDLPYDEVAMIERLLAVASVREIEQRLPEALDVLGRTLATVRTDLRELS